MSINTITIDFWNTLVIAGSNGEARQEARVRAVRQLGEKYNASITEEQVQQARRYADEKFKHDWLEKHRTQTSEELIANMLEYLSLPTEEDELRHLVSVFQNSLDDGPPDIAAGVPEALEELYHIAPLVIVSDTMFSPGKVLRNYLKKKKLFNYFRYFVFSDEIGVSKPHHRTFEKALAITGTPPHESVHIGDIEQTDITGARNMGMKTILYTGVSSSDEDQTTADFVCHNWHEIPNLIQSLHSGQSGTG